MDRDQIVSWVMDNFQLGDRRRSRALGEMVWGMLHATSVTFAAIGRCMEGMAKEASNIKRVFEFCHNPHVEPRVVQATLLQLLVGRALQTLGGISNLATVAVDWHDYNNGEISGLRVSLMTGSRALPLLWFEFKKSELKGRRRAIEIEAIQELIRLRPEGVRWLILLDSGFRSPELIRLLDQAGYYVVRSTSGIMVHSGTNCWTRIGDLPVLAGQIVEFGWLHWNRSNPMLLRLVGARLYDLKPARTGRRKVLHRTYKYAKPGLCVVATNLPLEQFSSTAVIRLYSRRFEIEHDFKDLKNASYGMDMEHVNLDETGTYEHLMCIVALSEAVLWLVGSEAEARGMHLDLTPSRPKDRHRVLSLRNVGKLRLDKIRRPIDELIETHLVKAMAQIPQVVGRRWRDAKTKLRLVSCALVPSQVPALTEGCATDTRGRKAPCQETSQWNVNIPTYLQAA